MKTVISTQSQNEVKDLLNEYVVSPLNVNLSKTLSKIEQEVKSLEETTKNKIGEISAVNGNISRLRDELDESFHFKDGEDAFEKINDAIKNSQEIIVKKIDDNQKALVDIYTQIDTILTEVKSDFKNTDKRINDVSENNKKEILTNVLGNFKKLCELLDSLKVTSDTSTQDIKTVISDFQFSILNELNSLSTMLKESFEQSEKKSEDIQHSLFSELHEIEKQTNEKYYELNAQINTTLQTVSTTLDEQNTKLSDYHEEINTAIQTINFQQMASIKQKYKTLFAVSLSFGIANTIGLIMIIVLYFLK